MSQLKLSKGTRMKNILCYGDSNTWGNIAGTLNPNLMLHQRYEYGIRWTSIVQQLLGSNYHIIEAGLNGRSTSFDETKISRPSRNGMAMLPHVMDMHYPLDLVIFMLGTNDVKVEFNASIEQILSGMRKLIKFVKTSNFGPDYKSPQVMLISPAPILRENLPFFDSVSVEKSHKLASQYAQLAIEEKCIFLDAASLVKISLNDGIHIERDSHSILAKEVAEKIKLIFKT